MEWAGGKGKHTCELVFTDIDSRGRIADRGGEVVDHVCNGAGNGRIGGR